MEKSNELAFVLGFWIVLVCLYYKFHDFIHRFVRNYPGIIMAVILFLTLVLLLFCVLFISIAQTDLDAHITNKVDERFATFTIICVFGCVLACLCVLALVALKQYM